MLASVFRLFGMEVLHQMKLKLFMPGKKAKTRYTVPRMLSSFQRTEDYDYDDVGGQSRTTTSSRRPWLHRQRISAAAAKLP